MVNIGGRSKGCSNCRKRRIKCDEHRPSCWRCQKCNLECTGVKGITFIEGTIVKSRRSNNQATKSPISDTAIGIPTDTQVSLSPLLRGNEFEIYLCYARRYLRQGAPLDLALQNTQLHEITASRISISNSQLFHRAFLSFSVIVYGAQHRDKSIVEKGYVMRGVVLKQLNLALSDPEGCTSNEVILSVITLALLDCIVPAGAGHYLKHMIGLQTLLDLRGPRSLGFYKSCWLHKSVRQMILFASLRVGKPSILAKSEWKEVLKDNVSGTELEEQELLDVLADCTALVARHNDGLMEQDETRQMTLGLLDRLRIWRKAWDGDEKNSCCEFPMPVEWQRPTHESTKDSPDWHPTTGFDFSDESAAVMFMFYNTALIYVFRILVSVGERPDTEFDTCSNRCGLQNVALCDQVWNENEYIAAERQAALDIYRCLPAYSERLTSSRGINTAPNVAWAVSTAWDTVGGQTSAYGRRMKDLLNARDQNVVAKGLWSS